LEREKRAESWLPAVIVLSLGWLLLYATRTALSSALKDIGDFWGLSQSYLGFLTSSFFLAYTVLQIPSGFLADRFGSRKILLAGFAIQALGLFLGAMSQSPSQFLVARVLTGAGQATYFACQQAIVSFTLPKERRSVGTATTIGGAGVGSALGFLTGRVLSLGGYGWKLPFVVLGAISCGYIVAIVMFVPEPKKNKAEVKATSTQVSPEPYHVPRMSGRISWLFLGLLSASHFLSMYGFYLMLTWLPYYLETVRGMGATLSSVIPIIMPLIMAPATLIGGAIADKKGDRCFVLKVAMPLAALATMVIPAAETLWSLVLALALYGATGKLVIDPGLVASVADNSPPDTRNTVLSIFNFWGASAMAVAPAVTGFIAEATGSFDVSFYAAGVFNLIGLAAFIAGTRLIAGAKPTGLTGIAEPGTRPYC